MKPTSSSTLDPVLDVPQLLTWIRQAGQIALGYFNKTLTLQYKADNTLVTQADVEIEQFLLERLYQAYPNHTFLSEEGTQLNLEYPAPHIWAIDPLDGTNSFVHGLPGWGISIGLLHQGQPYFGLFYMPLLDDITYTYGSDIYDNRGHSPSYAVQPAWGQQAFLAVSAGTHRDFQLNVPRTRTVGGVAAGLVYTARGTAVGAFIPKARLWDLVGGAAILRRAGGELRYQSGSSLDYLQLLDGDLAPEPILAGHPQVVDILQKSILPKQRIT